jgi:hypothetical protein
MRAGSCSNGMITWEQWSVRPAWWITRTGRHERVLFCNTALLPKGTFVATFGPVSRSQRHAKLVGYQFAVRCRKHCRHSACRVIASPVPNWEEHEFMDAMINHTCCLRHVHCEYVCTDVDEDGQQTVMVRTTRDVCMGEEFWAHFGEQFTSVPPTGCECCACRRATP